MERHLPQTATTDPGPAAAGVMITAPRSGQPPLRFRGRCVSEVEATLHGGRARITLWQRNCGGFVVGLRIDLPGECRTAAQTVQDLAGAIGFAETTRLADPPGAPANRRPRLDAVKAANELCGRSRLAALCQSYDDLVGDAIADWLAMDPA